MRENVAQQIESATGQAVARKKPKEAVLPVPVSTGRRGKSGAILMMRAHPRWKDIHADIIVGDKSPWKICEEYDLRTSFGNYAVAAVLKHRRRLHDKFPTLFGRTFEQVSNEVLVKEVTRSIQHAQAMAQTTFELASQQVREVKVGKKIKVISSPDFGTMGESQRNYLAATAKLHELATPPAEEVQQKGPQYNTQITLMALPKQEGVPQRAPVMIEAQRAG